MTEDSSKEMPQEFKDWAIEQANNGGYPQHPVSCFIAAALTTYKHLHPSPSGWISCKERLPTDGGYYWCYCAETNDLGISHFQWNCYFDPSARNFSDNRKLINVTHWQPLPPPPIPGDK